MNKPAATKSAENEQPHRADLVASVPPPENKRFYPALDGLRALAVLMVFCQHYLPNPAALRWGWTGVDIFFVLSGFLITGILYDTRNAAHRFRNFYVRRALRIFPLYYGVLLAALLLDPVYRWVWHPAWYLWPVYLGNYARMIWPHDWLTIPYVMDHLLSGNHHGPIPFVLFFGHFWSLAIEEQFYLVWPLVVFLVKDRIRLRNICVIVFFACLLARILCVFFLPLYQLQVGLLERFTPLRVDSLLLGGFLALTLRGSERGAIARLARPVMIALIALVACVYIYGLIRTHRIYRPEDFGFWVPTVGYSLIDIFAASLILRTIDPSTRFFRIFNNRRLRSLGQISYGFYVFHDIPHLIYLRLALKLVGQHSHLVLTTAAIALTSTSILSYLSFRFFEAPFLRLKSRFTV